MKNSEEGINNAITTFAITDPMNYDNVLLIDDAEGSGITLSEIATKLKDKKRLKK